MYRVEWEPPSKTTKGWISWFLDGEFVHSIEGASLADLTGASISSEPMSILLNVAISRTWGFPAPCPKGCDCDCLKDMDDGKFVDPCDNPTCACALPAGFCDDFPAELKGDYVRLYQSDHHSLGCSTKSRPTKLFIEGHRSRYMEEVSDLWKTNHHFTILTLFHSIRIFYSHLRSTMICP